jgi:peptidoglycan/LPS O-acetylase OafA/YrhL
MQHRWLGQPQSLFKGMIEIIRYVLALIVVQTHLWPVGIRTIGWQAVFAFYTLSGYLMTRVLHERYGFTASGRAAFLINRVLRLWPAYLVVIGATGLALRFYPLDRFLSNLTPPHSWFDAITNLTILGQAGFDYEFALLQARWAPTSWSLSIEFCSYCLLAFYFARTPRRLLGFALLGLIGISLSTGVCIARPAPFYGPYCALNRYGVVQAGFIPFALGGLIYFYRPAVRQHIGSFLPWYAVALLAGEVAVAKNTFFSVTFGPFLGAVMMFAVLAWHGAGTRPSTPIDFVGRAAYHLFIAHLSVAAVLVVGLGERVNSFAVFVLSVTLALAFSAALVPLEWRLNRLRNLVLRRATGNVPVGETSDGPRVRDISVADMRSERSIL